MLCWVVLSGVFLCYSGLFLFWIPSSSLLLLFQIPKWLLHHTYSVNHYGDRWAFFVIRNHFYPSLQLVMQQLSTDRKNSFNQKPLWGITTVKENIVDYLSGWCIHSLPCPWKTWEVRQRCQIISQAYVKGIRITFTRTENGYSMITSNLDFFSSYDCKLCKIKASK